MKKHLLSLLLFCGASLAALADNVTVTWHISNADKTVTYDYVQTVSVGTTISAIPGELQRDYITLSDFPGEFTANENVEKTLTFKFSTAYPFQYSATLDDAQWYTLGRTDKNDCYLYAKEDNTLFYSVAPTSNKAYAYFWALVGDPFNGFTVYNYLTARTGDTYRLGGNLTTNHVKMVETSDTDYRDQKWYISEPKDNYNTTFFLVCGEPRLKKYTTDKNASDFTPLSNALTPNYGYNQDGDTGLRGGSAHAGYADIKLKPTLVVPGGCTVTWNIKDPEGNILKTYEQSAKDGSTISAYPDGTATKFAVLPELTPFTVEGDMTKDVTAEWNNALVPVSASIEKAVWVRITGSDRGNDGTNFYQLNSADNTVQIGNNVLEGDPTYYWAFVSSNPFKSKNVTVYNMYAYLKDKNQLLGSNGSSLKVVPADDAEGYNTGFSIVAFTDKPTLFNLVDANGKSPDIRGIGTWATVNDGNWNWGQYGRVVLAVPDLPADQQVTDETEAFNNNVQPWLEGAGKGLFQLKSDVAASITSAYDTESLKTLCPSFAYNAINAIVSNPANLSWPETGYYRLHTVNATNTAEQVYLSFATDGTNKVTTIPESDKGSNLGSVVKINRGGNSGGAMPYYYSVGLQGKYLGDSSATWDTEYWLNFVPVAPGKAAIYLRWHDSVGDEIHMYTTCTDDNDYLNSDATHVAGLSGDRNGDTKWTFEPAEGVELTAPLTIVGSNAYGTLAVTFPYEVTSTNAKAYSLTVSKKSEGVYYADLNHIDGVVPAGEPVVVISDDTETTVTLKVNATTDPETISENALTGTYLPLSWSDHANDLVLGKRSEVVGFYRWSGATLGANKAYIEASALDAAGVREIVFRNGETTGIDAALNGSSAEAQLVYDLQGRRVSAAKQGLYVVNGKKVLVK